MKLSLPDYIAIVVLAGAFTVGCDSWNAYRVSGTITDLRGSPAGGIAVSVSTQPLALQDPPDSRDAVTGPDGRFATMAFGPRVLSVFSPPIPRVSTIFVYVWDNGWKENRVAVDRLPQPLLDKHSRAIAIPPNNLTVDRQSPGTRKTSIVF